MSPSGRVQSVKGSYRSTKQILCNVGALRKRSLSDIIDMAGVPNEITMDQVEDAVPLVACFVSAREGFLPLTHSATWLCCL